MPIPLAIGALVAGGTGVALRYIIPQIIAYVLVSLGMGFVTYFGTQEVMDFGLGYVQSQIDAIPSELVDVVEIMGVFDAFSIMIAGVTASMTVMAVSSVTKLRIKADPSGSLP